MTHVLSDEDAETYLELGVTPREVALLRWPHEVGVDCGDWPVWELSPIRTVRGLHAVADAIASGDWR